MPTHASIADVLSGCAGSHGLTTIKKGFAFDAAYDAAFALGWPHLRVLSGEPAKAPAKQARATLDRFESTHFVEWPREVAARFLRALGHRLQSAESIAALERGGDFELAEAEAVIDYVVRRAPVIGQRWIAPDLVLLTEAFVGAEPTARLVLDALERLTDAQWAESLPHVAEIAYQLGFLALRVPSRVREGLLARASALRERVVCVDDGCYGALMLDCVLNGRVGVERSGTQTLSRYEHALDAAEEIVALERQKIGAFYPSARLVFIAGEPLLALYAKRLKELRSREQQSRLIAQLAPIALPGVRSVMSALAAKSKVGDEAAAWLRTTKS